LNVINNFKQNRCIVDDFMTCDTICFCDGELKI
jgi:hypothetical protein